MIEKRRKSLYPEMRKARQNKENKVRLVKDKLFINDIQFIPENPEYESENEQTKNPNYSDNYQYRPRGSRDWNYQRGARSRGIPRDFQRSRTFTRSTRGGRPHGRWAPRQTFVERTPNFESRNMFTNLPIDDDNASMSGRSESRKNKASSPQRGNGPATMRK